MKASQILIKAAILVDKEKDSFRGGCGAIEEAAIETRHVLDARQYFKLLSPSNRVSFRKAWFNKGGFINNDELANNHRIIALCMAAAIAESEGN